MASHTVCCVSCDDSFAGESKGSCGTCGGALCEICFGVHEKGAEGKGPAKGHRFSRKDDARAKVALALLSSEGLSPSAARCSEHDEPVKLACTACAAPAVCVICGVSRHAGHTMLVLAEAAPVARALLREAAGMSSGSGSANTVETARSFSLLVTAEIDALPDRVAAAASRIDDFRDAVIAAAVSRHASLRTVSKEAHQTLKTQH